MSKNLSDLSEKLDEKVKNSANRILNSIFLLNKYNDRP